MTSPPISPPRQAGSKLGPGPNDAAAAGPPAAALSSGLAAGMCTAE
jgi:hypothetical protein